MTATRVSVIIPAWQSHHTIAATLSSLRAQTFRDFEVILVDSSPSEQTEQIVTDQFPEVRLIRSAARLYPQGARKRGVAVARGELIVFTDSHVLASPEWLARMVSAFDEHGGVVVGGIDCHGARLIDRAAHLCKFGKWLPYGRRRPIAMGPTVNILLSRRQYESAGGFTREEFLGDVTFSRALRANGQPLLFEPGAVVMHMHEHTMATLCAERFQRGVLYGELRWQWLTTPARILLLLATIFPLRLARVAMIVSLQTLRARPSWIRALPLSILGLAAALSGECAGMTRALFKMRAS